MLAPKNHFSIYFESDKEFLNHFETTKKLELQDLSFDIKCLPTNFYLKIKFVVMTQQILFLNKNLWEDTRKRSWSLKAWVRKG